jgi:hypothetical protein
MYINHETSLDDINVDTIYQLLDNDSDEDIFFDFKESISNTDQKEIHKIRQVISSFANTFGGFLFIGILDKKKKGKRDRIVGVNQKELIEIESTFSSKYLERDLCIPAINIEGPRTVEINDKDGKKVVVVIFKILNTSNGPYGVKCQNDKPIEFFTRSTGKKMPMDYLTMSLSFEKSREQRKWISIILIDIQYILKTAESNREIFTNLRHQKYPLRYESIIDENRIDIIKVFFSDTKLIEKVVNISKLMRAVYQLTKDYQSIGLTPSNNFSNGINTSLPVPDLSKAKVLEELIIHIERKNIVILKEAKLFQNYMLYHDDYSHYI